MTGHKRFKIHLAAMTILMLVGLSVSPAMAFAPPNDSFSNAAGINLGTLPFGATVNITEATTEGGEPFYCSFSYQTIWYKLTPATAVWLAADAHGGSLSGTLSVFRDTGSGLFGLAFVGCTFFDSSVTFFAQAGTTYYLQALAPCCFVTGDLRVNLAQVPAPQPVAQFYYYPNDPSIFDAVQFYDQSSDPGQVGIQSQAWDFGDGTTATGCCPLHGFAADGDYGVQLTVTTYDGRTASARDTVHVRTHDVAITKFTTPTAAGAGQTRQISVGLRNTQYPENVRVQLDKGVPGNFQGFQTIGTLDQFVAVRLSNRTTDFTFSYTFTGDDARVGKVTFRAVATLLSGRDAFPADNQQISSPVKVNTRAAVMVGDGDAAPASDESQGTTAARLALIGVTPNPARAGVDLVVRLSLAAEGAATLQVLDIGGRVMEERDLTSLGPGVHEARIAWQRRPAPGIYWVRLTQRDKSVSRRVGILQ